MAHSFPTRRSSGLRARVVGVRERDEARHSHDTAITQQATERAESERARSALESRRAELMTEHAGARARLLAMEAKLTDAQRRAEAEALASGAAAEQLRVMEVEIASRQAELRNVRLEIERDRKSTRLNSSHAITSRMPSSA